MKFDQSHHRFGAFFLCFFLPLCARISFQTRLEYRLIIPLSIQLAAFQQSFKIADRRVIVTASIGVSIYPRDGETVEILMSNAEAAMAHAKQLGSNQFQL